MMTYDNSSLWKQTLGAPGNSDIESLRVSYCSMRKHVKGLLDEIRSDFPNLTVHSIEHADSLWNIASLIIGEDYPINPLEGFVLGCSFLIHDSILSYKAFGGKDALRNTIEWKDNYQDIAGTPYDTEEGKQKIDFKVIRLLHAKHCEDILKREFPSLDGSSNYLLNDERMQNHYGSLIGKIASSHHWEADALSNLPAQVNALNPLPMDWTINPLKLACILRCADAAAIDNGRAPDYIFRLLSLNGVSKDHWIAQNRLAIALDNTDPTRLMITSTREFEEQDFSAWNVAYDAVQVIERELGKCQELLSEQDQFQIKTVAGAKSRKSLAKYIQTTGWTPSDVSVHISDVAKLIKTLGGRELYGKEDSLLIVLRELIQNARDAIRARRVVDKSNALGRIDIIVANTSEGVELSIVDDGVGMSLETISHSLLDFGNSFWHGDAVNVEFPGLKASGYKPVGQFGIGFFSSFMISKSVVVESRKFNEGLNDAHLVKFPSGLTLAPIFANYRSSSTAYSTIVKLTLDKKYEKWPSVYEVKRNQFQSTNLEVPFSAMLSTIVTGLDVDVYYKEFDTDSICVHHRIDAINFDKKAWLRELSFADYQKNKALDDFIDNNYTRLEFLRDGQGQINGLAAIGTELSQEQNFLGCSTIGGLLTGFHSRSSENWMGFLDTNPNSAKRDGGKFRASDDEIEEWVNKQLKLLDVANSKELVVRLRLQIAMQVFKVDPIDIAVAYCMDNSGAFYLMTLDLLVQNLVAGLKLIFVDAHYFSSSEDDGHGDSYIAPNDLKTNLKKDELLYVPVLNSGFLTYKLIDKVPQNDYGFIDCLYRTTLSKGYKLSFTYINNYCKSHLGVFDRAVVIETQLV